METYFVCLGALKITSSCCTESQNKASGFSWIMKPTPCSWNTVTVGKHSIQPMLICQNNSISSLSKPKSKTCNNKLTTWTITVGFNYQNNHGQREFFKSARFFWLTNHTAAITIEWVLIGATHNGNVSISDWFPGTVAIHRMTLPREFIKSKIKRSFSSNTIWKLTSAPLCIILHSQELVHKLVFTNTT